MPISRSMVLPATRSLGLRPTSAKTSSGELAGRDHSGTGEVPRLTVCLFLGDKRNESLGDISDEDELVRLSIGAITLAVPPFRAASKMAYKWLSSESGP
jgi:hypothetical protein